METNLSVYVWNFFLDTHLAYKSITWNSEKLNLPGHVKSYGQGFVILVNLR